MNSASSRVAWVDYSKGICIILIVMLHSVLGVEEAMGETGWLHPIVDFARPFRMPDFFLIAGIFLSRTIDRNWRHYLDKKVVHFAYFYFLWLVISFAFKGASFAADEGWAEVGRMFLLSFIEPFSTLWFIYLLAIFFVVTKLTRRLPKWSIWLVGAALQMAPIATGWTVIDEFASRFVFFYSGYIFAPLIFRYADFARERPWLSVVAVAVWAVVNEVLVLTGIAALPGVSLVLAYVGVGAIVTIGVLFSRLKITEPIRYAGANSIVIYLAFFIPMAASREILVRLGIISDVSIVSLIVWLTACITPVLLYWAVRNSWAKFLFKRPAWAYIYDRPARRLVPAE